MIYVSISLCADDGAAQQLGTLPFGSLAEAQADVRAARREAAADLVREGGDPARYRYEIRDVEGALLSEVPLVPGSACTRISPAGI